MKKPVNFYTILVTLCALVLGGCSPPYEKHRVSTEELYAEVLSLREYLQGTEMEIKILEEKVESQTIDQQKRRITQIEKTIQQLQNKLDSLSVKTTDSLSQHNNHIEQLDKKLEEIKKLRSMLSHLSKSTNGEQNENLYIVQQGDSLIKIARLHNTSVKSLKELNDLPSDQIFVGQTIKIP
jgi:LysM repeat protein